MRAGSDAEAAPQRFAVADDGRELVILCRVRERRP